MPTSVPARRSQLRGHPGDSIRDTTGPRGKGKRGSHAQFSGQPQGLGGRGRAVAELSDADSEERVPPPEGDGHQLCGCDIKQGELCRTLDKLLEIEDLGH